MRIIRSLALALVALALAAPSARAVEGFVIGLEGQDGSWSVPTDAIVSGSAHGNLPVSGDVAHLFADPLTTQSRMGLNLHLGWNVLGHAAIEAALQTGMWEAFDHDHRGGVGLVGGRLTYYPLQAILKNAHRQYDVGVEFGGGYSIAGGNTLNGGQAFGMDGKYIAFGLGAEWYATNWFSVALNWRYYMPFWSTFYYDFNNNVTTDVNGFHAGWNTLGIGVNFHMSAPN